MLRAGRRPGPRRPRSIQPPLQAPAAPAAAPGAEPVRLHQQSLPEKQKKRPWFFIDDDLFLRGMPRLKPEFILSAALKARHNVEPFPPGCQGEFSSPIMMVMVMLFAT